MSVTWKGAEGRKVAVEVVEVVREVDAVEAVVAATRSLAGGPHETSGTVVVVVLVFLTSVRVSPVQAVLMAVGLEVELWVSVVYSVVSMAARGCG